MIRSAAALAAIAAAAALSGCAIANPNAQTTPGRAPDGLRTPGDIVDAQRDPLVRVAVEYTLTQATWSPDTYVAQRGRLAELATGQARAQLTPRDGQSPAGVAGALKAAGASSTATLLGTDGPSARHDVVVAYKVRATGSARAPDSTDYHVARVTLTRQRATWLISTFAIEP